MTETQILTADVPARRDAAFRAEIQNWPDFQVVAYRHLLREIRAHGLGAQGLHLDPVFGDLLFRLSELENVVEEDVLRRGLPTRIPRPAEIKKAPLPVPAPPAKET